MDNVSEVMKEVVGDKGLVWVLLGVPQSKRTELMQQSSTEEEKTHAVSQYYVNCSPHPSWERLAIELYEKGEERAAMMAKQYLLKGMCIS